MKIVLEEKIHNYCLLPKTISKINSILEDSSERQPDKVA
jgi:hypothetical protein